MKKITVFCASSNDICPSFNELTAQTGVVLAGAGVHTIYGGGASGLMGILADKIVELKGKISGIIPHFMIEREWQHPLVEDMHIVEDLMERKKLLIERSDAILTLPGGYGTFDEVLDAITWKKLGLYHGEIYFLNEQNYFHHLLEMLDHAIEQKFSDGERLWKVLNSTEELEAVLKS
jgi:uncharacterized protein (TIGR00730 family)